MATEATDSASSQALAEQRDSTAQDYDDTMGVPDGFASMQSSPVMAARTPCDDAKSMFRQHSGNFWRADADFWDNLITGRWYLNNIPGGPQEVMASELGYMRSYLGKYQTLKCTGK